jgi:hypothetical protein
MDLEDGDPYCWRRSFPDDDEYPHPLRDIKDHMQLASDDFSNYVSN